MRRVLALVVRLPRRDQEVLALCAWSELTYREAATVLEIPVGTVRSRLARARARLAELDGNRPAREDTDGVKPNRASRKVVTHRRRRRIGLTAAALATGFGLATSLVLGGHDSASANTAERTPDGAIIVTLREGKNPEDLQQRLTDLGVPAVVDFLESGFGCDPSRSSAWVQEPRGEALFTHATSSDDESGWVLHPGQLQPGETAVFEFQIDEHEDQFAANMRLRLSTSPVGACVPVPNGSIVDAEEGIVGG